MGILDWLWSGKSLGEMLIDMVNGFLVDLLNSVLEWVDGFLIDLIAGILRVENLVTSNGTTVLTESMISDMYYFIYIFCCALIIVKLLFKGFKIYVLWKDGDADVSPMDMLIGMGMAAVTMVAFPLLYEIMADVTLYFADGIMSTLGGYGTSGSDSVLAVLRTLGSINAAVIILLIYAIMVFILWIKLLARGIELLLLRLGVPFACLGLIDSDMGMFKSYMQVFFKSLMTVVVQIMLISLSLRVLTTATITNLFIAIAMAAMAFKTPALLQQILIGNNGGAGVTSKIYSGTMIANSIKNLMR